MTKKVLKLQIAYVADVVIDVKKKRFGEEFVSLKDCLLVKQLVCNRLKMMGLLVEFGDEFFDESFIIQNGVITKSGCSLQNDINNMAIRNLIYDEEFIYLCLCEIMINKLNNSIERNCSTCNSYCIGGVNNENVSNCRRWKHDFSEDTKNALKKVLEMK